MGKIVQQAAAGHLLKWMAAIALLTALSGCGCALDEGEKKDSSYFAGCWNHLRDSAKNK